MKKINWTEIAIAAPTALAFGNIGGIQSMLVVSAVLAIVIGIVKMVETKSALQPIVVRTERRRR